MNGNGAKPMLEYALEALEVGPVFPCTGKLPAIPKERGGKGCLDATQIQIRVKDFWREYPEANPAICTDELIVIDFDSKGGVFPQNKLDLIAVYGELPKTRVHRTGGGGEHWLYRAPQGFKVSGSAGKYGFPGVDVRAYHQYILAPGAIHPETKRRYEILDHSPVVDATARLVDMVKGKTVTGLTDSVTEGQPIPEGERNHTLASFAGTMRRRGMPSAAIEAALLAVNRSQCQPPLPEGEVRAIAASVSRYAPASYPQARSGNWRYDHV